MKVTEIDPHLIDIRLGVKETFQGICKEAKYIIPQRGISNYFKDCILLEKVNSANDIVKKINQIPLELTTKNMQEIFTILSQTTKSNVVEPEISEEKAATEIKDLNHQYFDDEIAPILEYLFKQAKINGILILDYASITNEQALKEIISVRGKELMEDKISTIFTAVNMMETIGSL